MRVLVRFRRLINYLVGRRLLDKFDQVQVYAFSQLAQPLVQYGCDLLQTAWNAHGVAHVRSARCDGGRHLPGSGGVPNTRAHDYPHPGGQLALPRGFDGVREYEIARGQRVPNVTEDTIQDRHACVSVRGRARAVELIMGDVEQAYIEIGQRAYDRFVDAYLCFLAYYQ